MTKHCDEYIDDPAAPECLRAFLKHMRAPATQQYLTQEPPILYARYAGRRMRVVMASRFGDVGITQDLTARYGYDMRVTVDKLTDFTTVL